MRQFPDVQARLDQWKNQLIDTTKKNRLLFFTPLKTASVRLRDPEPGSLFDRLVREEKPLTFTRRETSAPAEACLDLEDTSQGENAPAVDSPVRCLSPGEVLTDRSDQELNAVLYRLRLRGRTAIAEQGVNILFVAFGILQWEDPHKREQRASPLILVPVDLRRQSALEPSRLFPTGEEALLNPTLAFLLQRDCRLTLPPLPDDLDNVGFEDYCRQVESLIHNKDGWSVRREAHFGTFSFQKLVIYSDLEANTDRVCSHPIVRALAGDTSGLSQPPGVPSIGEIDDALTPERTFQVLDADSSQQVAIEAAKRGASFVLQGPPGTGKSQTIANLIAEMLAAGKRVLFVAEKMAALQVVYSRLKARKLDDFCLEVHSAKASKQETLAELGRALPLKPEAAPPEFRTALSQLASLRRDLNGTVRALHTKQGAMGWTPFEVHGRLARLQHLPDLGFDDRDPAGLDPEVLAERNTVLMRMEGVRAVINGCETHPFRGCLIPEFTFQVQSEIEGRFLTLRDQLRALQEATGALAGACHLPAPASLKDIDWLIQVAERAGASPRPPAHWWADTDLERLSREVEGDERRFREYLERRAALLSRYRESLLALNLEDLRVRLAGLNEETLQAFRHGGAAARPVLWENAATLKPILDDAVPVLEQARSTLDSLSGTCGVAVQPTVRGLQRLVALTELAANDARPTQEWFTAARLRAITDRARTAAAVYPRLRPQRERLLMDYTPGILELDADAMIRRFRTSYAGWMRALKLSYWRDMRSLRGLRGASGKLTIEIALADLQRAREVQSDESWVRDNQAQLDAGLGVWFQAAESPWPEILASLERVRGMIEWFGQAPVSSKLIQLLTASGAELQGLQRLHAQAAQTALLAEKAIGKLAEAVEPSPVPFGATPLGELELYRLQAWVSVAREACAGFWSARAAVLEAAHEPRVLAWEQAVADLGEGLWLQREGEALNGLAEEMRTRYAHFFDGEKTDWSQIAHALDWALKFRALFPAGNVPAEVVRLVSAGGGNPASLGAATGPCRAERARVRPGIEYLTSLFTRMIFEPGGGIEAWSLGTLCAWLEERVQRSADLERWIDFRRVQAECERIGLAPFFTAVMNRCPEEGTLQDLFYRRFYRVWLDRVYAEEPLLRQFRGQEHERLIRQFRSLDGAQWKQYGPARVREAALARRQPMDGLVSPASEPGILRHELEKRRRHKPLRRLFSEIPNLIQELKPCLLMSPMTVSQLLDPSKFSFDLVIFDEASQICAEDAVGAIYRGKQVVVAGDRHQLPPTRFFTQSLVDGQDGDGGADGALDDDVYESVLDQCRALLPSHPLRWHYRSRHESLIAFSNAYIYSQDLLESLKTFPSARERGPGLGVEMVHVPGAVYDRSKSRRNPIEAEKVADLVIEHMRHTPRRSLGVVAFSEAQQMAILQEVERLRLRYPELEEQFREDRAEPFFVKNLESVQGDERDVIILNVGYGRDAGGELALNFGPITRQGGERRLNVAVTRAKHHIKLVTSLRANEIDLTKAKSEGMRLLRAYLEYAERGSAALPLAKPAAAGSVGATFEEAVRAALEEKGHTVIPRVGCGYRIDLAVQDPVDPNRYLLGVECDGPSYLAAGGSGGDNATARDRDRLTSAVLAGEEGGSGLGWRLHRVWSAEWVKAPEAEIRRIEEALARSQAQAEHAPAEAPPAAPEAVFVESPPKRSAAATWPPPKPPAGGHDPRPAGVMPYRRALLTRRGWADQFYHASVTERLDALKQVVAIEGPVRLVDAARRVAAAWDIRNAGSQVQTMVAEAAQEGVQRESLRVRDGFLWPVDLQAPPVRTHAGCEHVRVIEEICTEEIAEAVMLVMRRSFSIPETDLIVQTARTLGYARTGPDVRARIEEAVRSLVGAGRLRRESGVMCPGNS